MAGLQEQLDVAHAEAIAANRQRNQAHAHAATTETEHDRVVAEAAHQAQVRAQVEWDLRDQLAHTQNVVVEL